MVEQSSNTLYIPMGNDLQVGTNDLQAFKPALDHFVKGKQLNQWETTYCNFMLVHEDSNLSKPMFL